MTVCKKCGSDLTGSPLRAAAGVTLTDFLLDRAEPMEPIPEPGEPGYTEYHGYIICDDCDRRIPITPQMIHNSHEIEVI